MTPVRGLTSYEDSPLNGHCATEGGGKSSKNYHDEGTEQAFDAADALASAASFAA